MASYGSTKCWYAHQSFVECRHAHFQLIEEIHVVMMLLMIVCSLGMACDIGILLFRLPTSAAVLVTIIR